MRKIEKIEFSWLGRVCKSSSLQSLSVLLLLLLPTLFCLQFLFSLWIDPFATVSWNNPPFISFVVGVGITFLLALAEEILVRVLLFRFLLQRLSLIAACLFSSLIFTVLHLGNDAISSLMLFNIFIAGLFLALLYYLSEGVLIVTLWHFLWNFLQKDLLGYPVSGQLNPMNSLFSFSSKEGALFGELGGFENTFWATAILTFCLLLIIKEGFFGEKPS